MTPIQQKFYDYFRKLITDRRYSKDILCLDAYKFLCSKYRGIDTPEALYSFYKRFSYTNKLWLGKFQLPTVTDFSLEASQYEIIKRLCETIEFSDTVINPESKENELFSLLYKIIEEDDENWNDGLFPELMPIWGTKLIVNHNDLGERLVIYGSTSMAIQRQETYIFNNDYKIWVNVENFYIGKLWKICSKLRDRFPDINDEKCKEPIYPFKDY